MDIEHKIWEFQRFWFTRRARLVKPVPIGLILPLLISFLLSLKMFTFLTFDSEALPSKVTKKYGLRRYSAVLDWDESLIVFFSMLGLIILSLIIDIGNIEVLENLGKFSLYYAGWMLLPISSLDGAKLFFGSRPLFYFSWIIYLASFVLFFA